MNQKEKEKILDPRIAEATRVIQTDGDHVPVRLVGEQHVREDCGRIPSVQDWLGHIRVQPWMARGYPLEN